MRRWGTSGQTVLPAHLCYLSRFTSKSLSSWTRKMAEDSDRVSYRWTLTECTLETKGVTLLVPSKRGILPCIPDDFSHKSCSRRQTYSIYPCISHITGFRLSIPAALSTCSALLRFPFFTQRTLGVATWNQTEPWMDNRSSMLTVPLQPST